MLQFDGRARPEPAGAKNRAETGTPASNGEDSSRTAAGAGAGGALGRSPFPSPRATRLGLLLLVPGALLVGTVVASRAQSLARWADGDTLTAEALNGQFDALQARIDTLVAARTAPVTLSPDDARHDDLRWSLLHAAAVGACAASEGTRFAAAQTLPRPPSESCGDVCTGLYSTGIRPRCMAAVSVGQILTERATGSISVGHSFRYSCDTEDDGVGAPLEFGEAAIAEADHPRERLIEGYAQYCCCGVDVSPAPSDDGSGG